VTLDLVTDVDVVGVVPAAGGAVRLQPLSCSKEVLPVGGRPVLDYLVERMRAAPCDEVRVVVRPEKRDVAERAAALGARVVEGHPPSVADSLLLGMEGLAPDDVVLFGFPDSIWDPVDGFARLLAELGEEREVVLGLFSTHDLERSDVVVLGEPDRITEIHVKPERPPSELIWGCLAARVGALAGLRGFTEPGRYLDGLARAGRVHGVRFGTQFVDIGTPEALARHTDAVPS
jgi:glucose-1-phosphate thymidylyltransferase